MYDTILVGTDGSGPANRAVVHALDAARLSDATVHAMFVVDTDRYSEPALSSIELLTDDVEEYGNDVLNEVVGRATDMSVGIETRCCHGKPSQELIRYADEVDADLIVLGYQGEDHVGPQHVGSVADRVVRNAGRPVLVV